MNVGIEEKQLSLNDDGGNRIRDGRTELLCDTTVK